MPVVAGVPRGNAGTFTQGNRLAALGGVAKRGRVAFGASLGITAEMAEAFPDDLKRAMRKGASYRRERTSELAAMAGGSCGIGPSSMVASAGLSLAASRYVFALAALERDPIAKVKLFSLFAKLTAETRQNELAAYELAVREAKARGGDRGRADPLSGYCPPPALEQAVDEDAPESLTTPLVVTVATADVVSPASVNPNSSSSVIRTDGANANGDSSQPDKRT
jgi:pimeloyl-ACP methyl ester carboxylesterase